MSDACCTPKKNVSAEENRVDIPLGARTSSFKVAGMDCADEVSAIQNVFRRPDVFKVSANLITETVTVFHTKDLQENQIRGLIEKAGVKVVSGKSNSFFKDHSRRILLVGSSGLALGAGLIVDSIWGQNLTVIILHSLAICLGGAVIFPKALRSLKELHLDMNVLMTVAVVGAFIIKEYSEAASVVFLFSLAELLEALSVARARKAIRDVLNVTPKEALVVLEGSKTEARPVTALKIGDVVLVRPGENVPVDGTILEGTSTVNQASLTGESKAVDKKIGDTVWAGTINEAGLLKIRVEKDFSDTKIAKIISLVEEAQAEKAPSQRFVDKFSSIYTPAVLVLAFLVSVLPPLLGSGEWDVWIYKGLVLLVIGCPCALVIATPVSVVSGLTSLARRGVLVKGGVHLESLGKLRAMALDKTGTITNGTPKVAGLRIFSKDMNEDKVISLCATLESVSTHPLALAVLKYAKEKNVSFGHPENYRIITGKGAEGVIEGHWYFVGNHVLAHELGICGPEVEGYLSEVETRSMSVIVLGHRPHENCAGEILAVFALGDTIRSNAKEAVSQLHHAGVKEVVMLSGDNQKTVDAISKQVGIDVAKGALLPDDKVTEIKALVARYHFVGMVGDGVNDAPALAHATLGIAMGAGGSDTAIETADIALMKDDVGELPGAIRQGRRVLHIIRFNIFFAIAIKAVFFVLAFLNRTTLWMAVAADMGASLFVIFNALRLLGRK